MTTLSIVGRKQTPALTALLRDLFESCREDYCARASLEQILLVWREALPLLSLDYTFEISGCFVKCEVPPLNLDTKTAGLMEHSLTLSRSASFW